jgi:hypothetical protein
VGGLMRLDDAAGMEVKATARIASREQAADR